MSQYTTGEMAKLCGVSVRTVQFYDNKDLLKPTALTEGGRRLYSEADLQKLQLICLLKSLGLSLDAIKGILASEHPGKVLLLLLDEQEKEIGGEIDARQQQLRSIRTVKACIRDTHAIPVQTISDIEHMMKDMTNRKKLRRVHGTMIGVGIVMEAIEIYTLYLWIAKGLWVPFAIGFPLVLVMAYLLVRMYHKKVAYICPECDTTFQPTLRAMFFASHTPKTRKLTCPHCHHTGYCVERAHEA